MNKYIFMLCVTTLCYADPSPDLLKQQLEQLVQVDRQIETLQKTKLEHKQEMAEDLQRGSVGILPRAGRRESREAASEMQSINQINQQLQELELQRQNLLRALQ